MPSPTPSPGGRPERWSSKLCERCDSDQGRSTKTTNRRSRAAAYLLLAFFSGASQGCGSTEPDPAATVLNFTTAVSFALVHVGTLDPRYDLELRAFYEPTVGLPVAIGSQLIHLAAVDSQSQSVSLSMDLTPCLSDKPAASTCPVHVVLLLWLVNNGVKLDYQVLGPYDVSAGGITMLPGEVPVVEVVGMDLLPVAPTLAVGDTLPLVTRFFTFAGDTVARPVTWGSDNPAIASVDTAGVVTGRAAGQAIITAYWGEGQSSFGTAVQVTP